MDCLDEDEILAFADGRLDAEVRERATEHAAVCPDCCHLIAAAAGGASLATTGAAPAPAEPERLLRGASIGRYVILDLVGRGGMGEVYAAYDPQLDRKVALKLLRETALPGPSARALGVRLLREAKTLARLSHPNVVAVHDAGTIDDRIFVAMEFIEGETLADWLEAAPRSFAEIRDVFVAAGAGLAAAHEAGLVHRDFKPQNVMVRRDGAVRVTDFGLASDDTADGPEAAAEAREPAPHEILTTRAQAFTKTGGLLGTPLYMAPEQFLRRRADARTDQFSFCVALYGALYRDRPFPGESLPALGEAVTSGRVRDPGKKTGVPSYIRKLLLRGLETAPENRFPSMSSLLEALRRDPSRRRWRLAAAVVAAAALALGAGAAGREATREQRMCHGAADKLAGIWSATGTDGRQADIHRAFVATGRPYAEETWRRVSPLLDDYAGRWTRMYDDACQATHVRGDQSAAVLDLRMACLEGPLASLRALTDVLAHADGAVLVQAVNAAAALPPIDRCRDVALLRAAVPPPADARTHARVEALRRALAEVKAMTDTGQWPTARRKIGPIVEEASHLDYDVFYAEALSVRASIEARLGDPGELQTAELAVWTAMAARRDDVVFEAVTFLVGVLGFRGQFDEAVRWAQFGEALLRRLGGGHDRAAAWLANNVGVSRIHHGDPSGGLKDIERGLAIKIRALGEYHPDVAVSWSNVATVKAKLRDYAGALAAVDKALAIERRAYGDDSPMLATDLGNRGEYLGLMGRPDEAERDLRQAIARWPDQVGPEHRFTAYAMTALGRTLLERGRTAEARELLERALQIRERAEPDRELVAETRFALARALAAAGDRTSRAEALATAARATYEALPDRRLQGAEQLAAQLSEIDAWLARPRAGKPLQRSAAPAAPSALITPTAP